MADALGAPPNRRMGLLSIDALVGLLRGGAGAFFLIPPAAGLFAAVEHFRRRFGQLVARRIQRATERVRICSPVITSGPVLSTLAEVLDDEQCNLMITIDRPQMDQAVEQWNRDGRAQWKVPLVNRIRASGCVAEKRSKPYGGGAPYNYMHAKIVVCDDTVLTGSYNLSHSGEMNAENVLEIVSKPAADECAAFCEAVHARYTR